jgi:hypothetical protein
MNFIDKHIRDTIADHIQHDPMVDLSDLGNSIGIAIGEFITDTESNTRGFSKQDFIFGINHGLDIAEKRTSCDWTSVTVGDKIIAKIAIPSIDDPCHCFDKDERATITEISDTHIGIKDKFGSIQHFFKTPQADPNSYIDTWFKLAK